MADGGHLHRPGRYYRFFAYMSLFCFSMLGLVLAGNIFQVFIFWELVGICSYLLIGFYVERRSASTAANKAFIMNRVGDFGFLIGLMVLLDLVRHVPVLDAHDRQRQSSPDCSRCCGIPDGELTVDRGRQRRATARPDWCSTRTSRIMLLVVAGLGVFAGCVGKSAQFPLQTWLPDAMEGPTPVSALVHSATMVAAGVYLAGRFFRCLRPRCCSRSPTSAA